MIASDVWTITDGGTACILWDGLSWSGGAGVGGAPSTDASDASRYVVIMTGDTATILEDAIVDSLKMDLGAVLAISKYLNVQSSSVTLDPTSTVIIKSAGESSYGQYYGPAMPNTTVEMKLENYGWHQLASPINGAIMSDLQVTNSAGNPGNLIFASTPSVLEGDTSQFRWYSTQDYGGVNIGNGKGEGYSNAFGKWYGSMATDNFDNRASMLFVNATVTDDTPLPVTVHITGTTNALSKSTLTDVDNSGWNMVSNPYPTALDWESIEGRLFSNPTLWKFSNTISIWEPANQNYAIYMAESGVGTNGTNVNGGAGVPLSMGARYVAPFQSFWVQRSDFRGENTGTTDPLNLTIEPIDRAEGMSPKHFRMSENSDDLKRIRVQLSNASNSYTDEMVVNFKDQYSSTLSSKKDAVKLPSMNRQVPMIMTQSEGRNLAIHGRDLPEEGARIPLYIEASLGEKLMIKLTERPLDMFVWLEDVNTGTYYEVYETEFSFTNFEEGLSHTYNLVFSNSPEIPEDIEVVYYQSEGQIHLEFDPNSDKVITILDILGRVLITDELPTGISEYKFDLGNRQPQSYLINIMTMERNQVIKVMTK